MTEPHSTVDIERLVDDLKHRLEERRRSGLYPPGLEEQLDEHARQFAGHLVEPPDPLPPLRAAVAEVAATRDINRVEVEPTSSTPIGVKLHQVVERSQRRHLDPVVAQVQAFAAAVTDALDRSLDVLDQPPHDYQAVLQQLDAILERISALEAGAALGGALGALLDRVERLEAAEQDRRFKPFFSNVQFEGAFRGSRDELRGRYADVADRLAGFPPILDIGCGQGVLLELLTERGTEVMGVELDPELARVCQAQGLRAEAGDGMQVLQAQPDGSLGAITLMQVVEHLSHQQVADLFLMAHQKLRAGGILAIETVNPQSLYVYARAFYLDPTHSTPVHPAYLGFLSDEAGFSGHQIEWRSLVADDEALVEETESARRLNRVLFAPQDYLFLAER